MHRRQVFLRVERQGYKTPVHIFKIAIAIGSDPKAAIPGTEYATGIRMRHQRFRVYTAAGRMINVNAITGSDPENARVDLGDRLDLILHEPRIMVEHKMQLSICPLH